MRRSFRRQFVTVATCALALVLVVGCSRSRSLDRAKVLEAENINLRQKSLTVEQQMRQAHAAQDDAVAREQQLRAELALAQEDARAAQEARTQAAAAHEALLATQSDLDRAEQRLADANKRYEKLKALQARPVVVPRTTARGPALRFGGASPEVEAMRRDLQKHLSSYGVRDLNVEVRTDRTGRQRVAIVLPDAFPPGKATLAYNKAAVGAVMSVGKMIRDQYPESVVLVEGHTDSDPIRKSGWGTNEKLAHARAKAVQTLLTTSGVPAQQVATEGLGARQPLAMGSTKRAKSRNRRVEIFIAPRN